MSVKHQFYFVSFFPLSHLFSYCAVFYRLFGPISSLPHSPENAFCLVSIETQNLFREASLYPWQLAVWISLLLECHDLLKGGPKHGRVEDGVPGMLDFLYAGFLHTLKKCDRNAHTDTHR